ncbi:MAG TPA: peptidoglycan DD-metalloendopeptidase family protein [Candidatus Limnocylindrales bacterium]|nr:peptidoglycan DD-metalloendopeptidase family protein [Candidatus Limnocylindrales bacterium]
MLPRLALIAITVLALVTTGPTYAATPPEDPEKPASMHCVTRLPALNITNVMEAKWSPDSTKLLLVWFAQLPSPRSVTGYREQEITDMLDLKTGSLRPVGVGDHPLWSGTGRYVSYWGPDADELRIVENERVIARLGPTVPEMRWVADGLVFIEKDQIREWRDGAVRTIAKIDAPYVPAYPRDDVYFSADATRFTLTRYSLDGTVERFIGTTRTGQILPLGLDGARYTEWAPDGQTLLVRYLDRIEMRDFERNEVRIARLADLNGVVHTWAPDGRTLLFGDVTATIPGGNAFDTFRVWDGRSGAPAATLPNVLGARTFSPDGRYFVGVSRIDGHTTQLELYRCAGTPDAARPDPSAPERAAKIDAAKERLVRPTAGEITQFLQGAHTGIDVAAPLGSLITADDDGVVTATSWVDVGGNRVCVQHTGGLESCFYHTSAPLVSVGERVVRGQPIALIGMTGVTTGPHTHWETKQSGRIVDPLTR